MPEKRSVLFVVDNTALISDIYSRIVDLALSGERGYLVEVALLDNRSINVIADATAPSVQMLRDLQSKVARIDHDLQRHAYDSSAAVVEAALHWAQSELENAENNELVVMTDNATSDEHLAAEVVAKVKKSGITGYLVCSSHGAAISGLTAPPWLAKGGSISPPPVKTVSLVKTYAGSFTVGNPSEPLITIPVFSYPATRRAPAVITSTFKGDNVAVSSYQMQTSGGPPSRPEDVQRGFTYLSEVVTANNEVLNLMDGEFAGAERWNKALELLATTPEVPPWIPLGGSDVIVGADPSSELFIAALHSALKKANMHAVARISKGPRGGNCKGALELTVLQPHGEGLLLSTPLPFAEELKSYYNFAGILPEATAEHKELDSLMDDLVSGMSVDMVELPRNQAITRPGGFIKSYLVNGSAIIPPACPLLEFPKRPDSQKLSSDLVQQFGIAELSTDPAQPAPPEHSQEVSYQATQNELDIDDLL